MTIRPGVNIEGNSWPTPYNKEEFETTCLVELIASLISQVLEEKSLFDGRTTNSRLLRNLLDVMNSRLLRNSA